MLRLEVYLLFSARENSVHTESYQFAMRVCNNLTYTFTHSIGAENFFIMPRKLGEVLEASVFAVSQDVPPKMYRLFLKETGTENYLKPFPN